MIGIKEKSLTKALVAAGCQELPRAFNENDVDFWIKAIALVRKRNGSQSYCLVDHAPDGKVLYMEDFGEMSPIYSLLSIHPYLVLDKSKFGFFDKEESFRRRVPGFGVTLEEYDAMSKEEKQIMRYKVAIGSQLRKDEELQMAAEYHEDVVGEDGLVDLFADDKPDEINGYVPDREEKKSFNTLIAEDGSLEEFTDVVEHKARKRGRPKK